ncbi:MAG TPA: hypothetical protein VIU12_15580 [Chryseolinea sp.]
MKKIKTLPFDFVLDELFPAEPVTRPMFGGHAIYVKDKIVMMLRKKDTLVHDNGVWLATTFDHHESLRKELPSMRTIRLFGVKESGWQNLPEDAPDFEEEVIHACRLILKGDVRLGKVPASKKKATPAKKNELKKKKALKKPTPAKKGSTVAKKALKKKKP